VHAGRSWPSGVTARSATAGGRRRSRIPGTGLTGWWEPVNSVSPYLMTLLSLRETQTLSASTGENRSRNATCRSGLSRSSGPTTFSSVVDAVRARLTLTSSAWEQHGNREGSIRVDWSQTSPNWCCPDRLGGAYVDGVRRFPKPCVAGSNPAGAQKKWRRRPSARSSVLAAVSRCWLPRMAKSRRTGS
jgi:hypothetical protein